MDSHDVLVVDKELENSKSERVSQAKQNEIEKWKEEAVYDEVEDVGQQKISTTWVITEKEKEGVTVTKARLVARGNEESNEDIKTNSPTCMKDSVRMVLAIAAGKGWKVRSLDVKAAFLQGKEIERNLYLQPPPEFRKKGFVWKLKKVVYGLCDASRSWYLRVVEVLTELGMKVESLDKAVFTYKEKDLQGIVLVHVDDMLYVGTQRFLDQIMEPFKKKLKVSRDDSIAFKYLGVNMKQTQKGVELDQNDYLHAMKLDLLPKQAMTDKDRFANEEEITLFRQGIGQLGWLASVCKPEASFDYCTLSTVQSNPQVRDFLTYRKAVRNLQALDWKIVIGSVDVGDARVCVFCDASFGNLAGGSSQIGYIVFMYDSRGICAPLTWASKKAKRVARSTLVAETLSAVEAADTAVFLKRNLEEILSIEIPPVTLFVDNKSLFDTVNSTGMVTERRLLVDLAALREMQEKRVINIEWVSTQQQLADCLTKAGANKQKLVNVLCDGKLDFDMVRSG